MINSISIGIMAYNEEAIIGLLLEAVLKQTPFHDRLKEIIVVASGCSDRTEDIVRSFIINDNRIKLISQPQREGKASAINLFLHNASGDILILASADIIPENDTIDKLIAPFADQCIGMTGTRPIPVNSQNTFIGYAVHLLWRLHHRIALNNPKLGEMVAFRNILHHIPHDTAVDEASIEALIQKAGYKLHYEPQAIVRNKGPETLADFILQRRRIAAGHQHLARQNNYIVSTHSLLKILSCLLKEQVWSIRCVIWTSGVILLEALGRLLGCYDYYIRKKNPYIWNRVGSTKKWP